MIATINIVAITLSIIISAAIPAHNILESVFNNTEDVYMYTVGCIPACVFLLRSYKAEAAQMHLLIPAKTLNSERLKVFFIHVSVFLWLLAGHSRHISLSLSQNVSLSLHGLNW